MWRGTLVVWSGWSWRITLPRADHPNESVSIITVFEAGSMLLRYRRAASSCLGRRCPSFSPAFPAATAVLRSCPCHETLSKHYLCYCISAVWGGSFRNETPSPSSLRAAVWLGPSISGSSQVLFCPAPTYTQPEPARRRGQLAGVLDAPARAYLPSIDSSGISCLNSTPAAAASE